LRTTSKLGFKYRKFSCGLFAPKLWVENKNFITNIRNICKDLEIIDNDSAYSAERLGVIIKDGISVINTECYRISEKISSFEETNEPAVKDITAPLVQTLKGFITNIKSVSDVCHNKLFHLRLRSMQEASGSGKTNSPVNVRKNDLLKDIPIASNIPSQIGSKTNLHRPSDLRQSLNDQKDIEKQITQISDEMVECCLAVEYQDYRGRLLEIHKSYRNLASSLANTEVFAINQAKGHDSIKYYKTVFQQHIPNTIYSLIRLTYMFEAHDPKKLKQKLSDLPRNNIEDKSRKEILAEIERDSKYLKTSKFSSEAQSTHLPSISANLSKISDQYTKGTSLITDLVYMYIALQTTAGKSDRQDLLSAFSNSWNSTGRLTKYSSEIERTVVGWLWQPAQIGAK
jgi:hypothetical protein